MNSFRLIFLFFLIFTSICVSSCTRKLQKVFPGMQEMEFKEGFNDSSPEFRAGWRDGCETGIASGSNTFYKMFYQNNRVDGYRMSASQDYRDAWEPAYWFCFRSTYIHQKSSMWSAFFKGIR